MYKSQEGIGARGALVPGPPWILGHRGVPREAPENTLAGLTRALELGLDGLHYPVRACRSGELFLLGDATLDRTSDASGPLSLRTLPELYGVDAGGWFAKRFLGEPLPTLEEALALPGARPGAAPIHVIELAEPGILDDALHVLAGGARQLSVRVASPHRGVCLAAEAAGVPAMLLCAEAGEDERRFAAEEQLTAIGAGAGGFAPGEWRCERWGIALDAPADLLAACRAQLFGFCTSEPGRALSIRALVHLAPHDHGPYPLEVPRLVVHVDPHATRAVWRGDWRVVARVRNPLPFRARIALELVVRRGAFETDGLPARGELDPGAEQEFEFGLRGGAWIPGGDPLLLAHFFWTRGPGRPGEVLTLDAPLERVREIALTQSAERLFLIPERPGDPVGSLTARRQGRHLLLAIENAAGLADARVIAHVDGAHYRGGRGLRILLPRDFELRADGVPFSAGIVGREGRAERVRRWAGGVPPTIESGAPGRLLPRAMS